MSNSKLIKLCLKNNKKAWKLFLKKYSRLIYWAINKNLARGSFNQQQNEAEDIFQEVFLSILEDKKLQQVKNIDLLPGWLAMVASNQTIDYMRRKNRIKESLVAEFPITGSQSLQEKISGQDTFSLVDKVIENLSNKEKIIISLNLFEDKTHKEIAGILSLPVNTVSTIIFRTKEKIKSKIKKMKEN